jgi:hypothetical protein
MFTALVDLAFVALFDVGADGAAHPFPVHSRMKSLFKTCCPRILQVVVIPSYCTVLKVLAGMASLPSLHRTFTLSINSKE